MFITFLRTIILYFVVIFGVRLMGKRQIAQLQPSELAVAVLVSNIATLPFEDTDLPIFVGIIPILTLISLDVLVSFISLKSKKLRKLLSGSPIIVIKDGIINQKALLDIRFTPEDLISQLRAKDIFDLNEVSLAIVETNGTLSVYKEFSARELDAKMVGLNPTPEDKILPPSVVISHGNFDLDGLSFCGQTKKWVETVLKRKKLKVADVFLMTCDQNKNFTIIKKDDKI